jgi:ABC-2 type transport system permease protein
VWRRALTLLWRFSVVSFQNSSAFRLDFLTSIAHNLVYQGIFITFWMSVMNHSPGPLGQWSFPELSILTASTLIAGALMQWSSGLVQLPAKVIRGDLDRYLCRPVSPLFALLAEEVNALESFYQLASALLLLGSICIYYQVPVTLGAAAASLGLLFIGTLVVLLVQACVGLLSFWYGEVSRLNRMLLLTREFERYPLDLFPLWIQGTLTWIVPIGLISTYPVLVLLNKAQAETFAMYLAIGVVLLIVWVLIFLWMWARALRRYESFGG